MNLASLSIKRPIFITCIVSLMLILGFFSLKKMPVDLFPDVTFPIVFVQTIYPGASPVDVEKLIVKPIEDELGSLSGLKTLTSTAAESVGYVILEFQLGTDVKDAEQQVRQRLGNIQRTLPADMETPIVRRFDPADQAIIRLAVISEMPPAELFDMVDELVKPQFETIDGVGQVDIIGGRKREIQVLVDKKKVEDRRLSLSQIADKIRATSKDVPVGKLDSGKSEMSYRASGEFESIGSINNVNVSFFGSDVSTPLSQVARVVEGLEEETAFSTLMTRGGNFERKPAIFLDVFKQSGGNSVAVVDQVLSRLGKVNETLAAKGISAKIERVRDTAGPIRLNIFDVTESIVIGIILCVVVVLFFLGSFRSTFITGMALPNSLLGGFVLMYAMGFSINIMSLLALSLAVGLLIDDAIVVRENIFRHLEMGKSPKDAALEGTSEVALAVVATTLVVIAVFGPIAFLDGIIGQFFRQFGLTVCFTMLISLFDAFTVAPMLSAYMAAPVHGEKKGFWNSIFKKFDAFQTKLENVYVVILKWVMRYRMVTLGGAVVIFVASMSLVAFIPKTFLPAGDNGEFAVMVELPVGSSMSQTKETVKAVEDRLKELSEIELMATVVGSTQGASAANKGTVFVALVPAKERSANTSQVKEKVREFFKGDTSGTIFSVGDIDIGGGNQKIFNLNLFGENLEELAAYADKFKARFEKIPGVVDVDTNFRAGKPEFHVAFDRVKSEQLGVSTVMAGAELRARVEGTVASTYRKDGREYDIRVRLDEQDRDLRKNFNSTLVPNVNMDKIPLNRVAHGVEKVAYSQINRSNKARYIQINAGLGPDGSLGTVMAEAERILKEDPELKMPAGISYRFLGQAENFQELIANMLMAMFLGVVFIYLVLASLYESFVTPFAILLALPLAICGAMVALFMFGKSIDLFSMIGIVLLLGVVAKNSILLVDYTNQMMDQGVDRTKALIEAGRVRLRPILMTSLALIAGMIPIAYGLNEASAQRTSMGIAIIGGLISSTILTLVVVPAAFGYIDDFRIFFHRKILRRKDYNPHGQGPTPPTSSTNGHHDLPMAK
ncbi:MAG: efflux RND transporter permease subunit [Bdellovibrionaceae bacterium]|nr:efflux RND transporter permease subunit [Pseudobdellovibrionaceae bacterium]